MSDHVVVDVEIQKTIGPPDNLTWDDTDKMGVAVACLWEYKTRRMRVYGPEDVPVLRQRLLKADRISGYNIWKFDFPVIWGLRKEQWRDQRTKAELSLKTDDLLRRIWQALGLDPDTFGPEHKGWGLDAVASATLNASKIGYGGEAPRWYQAGQIQKVVNYCADDVALERDLCDFIDRYGYVRNTSVGRSPAIPTWNPANF